MNRRIQKGLKLSVIVIVIFIVFFSIIHLIDSKKNDDLYDKYADQSFSYIEINGKKYKQKDGIELILSVGLDSYENVVSDGYTNNKLADFVTLLIVDNKNKTTLPIHINRDTMCDITILGIGGKHAGSTYEQLCLAHSYGKGDMSSLINVKDAVSKLLHNVTIDYYLSLSMDAISKINDDVDGITVYVEDDFSNINPNIKQNEYVTLWGDEALTFVRARYGLEDSSNLNRMNRQRTYLRALYNKCRDKRNDDKFIYNILSDVSNSLIANADEYGLSDLGNTLLDYELLDALPIQGEAIKGRENMEYYVDQRDLDSICINYLFDEVEVKEGEING